MANSKFKPHPIVSKLERTGAVRIFGYFGGSADGVVKVYPSLDDLTVCLQIREGDILHVEDAPEDVLPHGGSAIWVKPDAMIEQSINQYTSIQARYLAGGIASQMTGGPGVAYAAKKEDQPATFGPAGCTYGGTGCNFSVWPCSVVWGACLKSNDSPCQHTKQFWCPTEIYTAKSCFTCAGYTCVAQCYSAGCPPTHKCPQTFQYSNCCEIYSAAVC
jgi:hypothetical protein